MAMVRAVSCVIASIGLACFAVGCTGPDHIRLVDGDEHDFGIVELGSVKSHEFMIENTGRRSVVLGVGAKSCHCLFSEFGEKRIAGRSKLAVPVEYAAQFSGQVSYFMNLVSKCRNDISLMLTVKADVRPPVGVSPSRLDINIAGAAGDIVEKIELTRNFASGDLSQLNVDWTPSGLFDLDVTEMPTSDESRRMLAIRPRMQPDASGYYEGHLLVTTSGSETTLPMTFSADGPVSTSPKSLNLGILRKEHNCQIMVQLVNECDGWKFATAECVEPFGAVAAEETGENRLLLTFHPSSAQAPGMFVRTLILRFVNDNTNEAHNVYLVARGSVSH